MLGIITYKSEDIWTIIDKILKFEDMIDEASIKTKKKVIVDTEIKYFMKEDQWEGTVIVEDAEKSR